MLRMALVAIVGFALVGCFGPSDGGGSADAGTDAGDGDRAGGNGGSGGFGAIGGTGGTGGAFPGGCGNGFFEPMFEQCEPFPLDLGGESCASATVGVLPNGPLGCNADCSLNVSLCVAGPSTVFGPCAGTTCSDEEREVACDTLLGCDFLPEYGVSRSRCEQEISLPCAECMLGRVMLDDSDAAVTDCSEPDCIDACATFANTPVNIAECAALVVALPVTGVEQTCLCQSCLSNVATCVAQDDCWVLAHCVFRTGCEGPTCLEPGVCGGLVDVVGMGSAAVNGVLSLGNCLSTCTGVP